MPAANDTSAQRKRPRTSGPRPAPTSAPAPTTPAPPPLSALAARRAQQQQQQQLAPVTTLAQGRSDDEGSHSGDSGSDSDASSSRAPVPVQPPRKQQPKNKAPARYFAAPEEQRPATTLPPSEDAQMDDAGDLSPPEGLDPASDRELDVLELATPVRARRRREKSAFVDPTCLSAFHVLDGVNAVQTTVADEGGVLRDAVVYCLQFGESLVIRGACTLTPVLGAVNVLGATLRAPLTSHEDPAITLPSLSASSSHPLFAPSSHPLPPITGAPPPTPRPQSGSLLLPSGETFDLTPYDAVVLVSDLATGIDGIERVLVAGGMGQGAGMFSRRKGTAVPAQGGATWSLVLEPEPSLASLRPIDPWISALAATVPPHSNDDDDGDAADRLVALVEGPKRVGKSTFAKMLLNSLLDRYGAVAYLDTDLGQPEFTPPGFLSLSVLRRPILGPAFTHLSLPLASRFLGSTSPASDPSAYLAAAQALLETYALEVEFPLDAPSGASERVPLVINTQGWVKGLGADLLAKLKAVARPTHVFSFAADIDAPFSAAPALGAATTLLPPAPPSPLESKWSAADYRTLSLVAYFHAIFHPEHAPAWDFTRPLIAQAPYALDFAADVPRGAHLVGAAGAGVPRTHVLHALNGALVALVAAPTHEGAAHEGHALGLALVHSVVPAPSGATAGATLHLHTPVPASVLADARADLALVKGEVDLPVTLMLDWSADPQAAQEGVAGVAWRDVPFLGVEGAAAGAGGRRRVRRNLMRRGQA